MPAVGAPTAAAMCIGPESSATTQSARRASAANPRSDVFPAMLNERRVICAAVWATSTASLLPPVSNTGAPNAAPSASPMTAKCALGQCGACAVMPRAEWKITNGSPPTVCWSNLSASASSAAVSLMFTW